MRSAWSSTAPADAPVGRPLSPGETELARSVYGEAVRFEPVRIHAGGFGPFAVTIGSRLFMPPGLKRADFAVAELRLQALFIHELAHVWQFQTRPLWTLASWAKTVLEGGYGRGLPGYRYTLPVQAFDRLNLEQQASLIEHAFMIRRGGWPAHLRHAGDARAVLGAAPF